MGYYSQVALIIEFESPEKMKNFIALELIADTGCRAALEQCAFDLDIGVISYQTDYIKWHESAPTVIALTRLFKTAHAKYNAAYRLIIVGEDLNDLQDEAGDARVPWKTDGETRYAEYIYEINIIARIDDNLTTSLTNTFGEIRRKLQ